MASSPLRRCYETYFNEVEMIWQTTGHVRIDGVDRAVPELKTVTPATSCERVTDRPSCKTPRSMTTRTDTALNATMR